MCGIAGAYSASGAPIPRRLLDTLRRQIAHRGPDGEGTMQEGRLGLVHTRLAILDLSEVASQPMWTPDRSACLCYNGEIYNFQQLRDELTEEAGLEFRSTGDTEVLLAACRHWGVRATLERLNGMFAFAYWDARAQELWLARDRMGIKPLFICRDTDRLLFASEIKALLAGCSRTPAPDMTSLFEILDGGTNWEPYTAFHGIEALQPGHFVRLGRGRDEPVQERYFDVFDNIHEKLYRSYESASFAEMTARFQQLMRHSVAIHSVSDAPLATLASGGIDSSLICALAKDQRPDMWLYHAEVVGPQSEAAFARQVAEHLELSLVVAQMDGDEYVEQLVRTTWFHEAPSAYHPNDVPFQVVSQRAGQDGIKVLLTGEGSDELFIGYGHACKRILRSRLRALMDRGGRVLGPLRSLILPVLGHRLIDVLSSRGGQAAWVRAAEQAYGFIDDPVERSALVINTLYLKAHLNSLLQRNDRMGMMHGLESRIPFLENDVVLFGLNLPLRHKHPYTLLELLRGHPMKRNKAVVRAAAEHLLPREIVRRKKLGFPVTPETYLSIGPCFFRNGFLENALGMGHPQMSATLAQLPGDERWNLFTTEIFGRLFFLGESIESVSARLERRPARRAA